MDKQKEQIFNILYEIKEQIKSLCTSIESIKSALTTQKPFDDGRLVEIDSLKTQREEMIKQTGEMRKQTKYLMCTFVFSIITLLINIILIIIRGCI